MIKRKIKVKEGDVFAVPLLQGCFGIGLITRRYKKSSLGYFFDITSSSLPKEVKIDKLKIVFIAQFSAIGIEEGEWPLIETDFKFDREEWPIPLLKMQHPITEQYFSVQYDDTLFDDERKLITKEQADKLFGHESYGYVALEEKLSSILKK
jgi:Immunity protein 26